MRIGIVSDTHGDVAAWDQLWDKLFKGVDMILHAGDVLYHGPRNPLVAGYAPGELAGRINNCSVPVLIARGNCDADVDQTVLNTPLYSPCLVLQVMGLTVLVHHGHSLSKNEVLIMGAGKSPALVISGHSHLPLLQREGGVLWLNPGSPSLPKGDQGPTAAIWDGKQISLVSLEGKLIESEELVGSS